MQQPRPTTSTGGRKGATSSLDQETLYSIHKVLLGAEQREFPDTWRGGFAFREGEHALRCGIRQREGGPCGVLAAVQAYILREVYIAADGQPVDLRAVTREAAGEALVRALAHIIWSARVGRSASVCGCRSPELPPLRAAAGAVSVTQCSSQADVLGAVRTCIGAYRSADGPGIALLLYSLALTRGIAMVVRDADFATPLIAANGYCSQELVNLLLIGRAHSNVFDGEQTVGGEAAGLSGQLADGAEQGCRLRGIPRTSLIGFLTLFEKQGGGGHELLIVGSHYKRPHLPIFVVQSESHYSCLWAADCGARPVPDILADPSDRLAGDPEPEFGAAVDDDDEPPPPQLAAGESFDLLL